MGILNNDPAIDGKIVASLIGDVNKLLAELKDAQDASAIQKTIAILNSQTDLMNQYVALARSMRLAEANGMWIGHKNWAKAFKTANAVCNPAGGLGILMKGLLLFAGVSNEIFASYFRV